MNLKTIENALSSAVRLLYDELESVVDDGLREEYLVVIKELELAMEEIGKKRQ